MGHLERLMRDGMVEREAVITLASNPQAAHLGALPTQIRWHDQSRRSVRCGRSGDLLKLKHETVSAQVRRPWS